MALTFVDKAIIKDIPGLRIVITEILGDNSYPSGGYEIDCESLYDITTILSSYLYPEEIEDTPGYLVKLFPHSLYTGKSILRIYDAIGTELPNGYDVSSIETVLTFFGAYRK